MTVKSDPFEFELKDPCADLELKWFQNEEYLITAAKKDLKFPGFKVGNKKSAFIEEYCSQEYKLYA